MIFKAIPVIVSTVSIDNPDSQEGDIFIAIKGDVTTGIIYRRGSGQRGRLYHRPEESDFAPGK